MQEITIDKTSDTVQTMLLEKDTIRTEPNGLTPEIYASVRKSVGMKEYNREDVETALQNTLFSVVIREKEQPIGIGRVIGDGRIAFFIKDVAIIPERQGQGIGIMIMEKQIIVLVGAYLLVLFIYFLVQKMGKGYNLTVVMLLLAGVTVLLNMRAGLYQVDGAGSFLAVMETVGGYLVLVIAESIALGMFYRSFMKQYPA